MTNSEIEWLLARTRREPIPPDRIGQGGANPGDSLVWDGEHWVPTPAPVSPGTNVRGADLALNFQSQAEEQVAVAVHNLESGALTVQLLTTAFDGLWATFAAPWRILDSNRIEVRAQQGFTGPARAIVTALVTA
jgi:hypothetical protein